MEKIKLINYPINKTVGNNELFLDEIYLGKSQLSCYNCKSEAIVKINNEYEEVILCQKCLKAENIQNDLIDAIINNDYDKVQEISNQHLNQPNI